jgi:beta-glucanase (GH16 family)
MRLTCRILTLCTFITLLGAAIGAPQHAAPAQTINLALNRPVVASSTESSAFPASAAVDGNTGTRWSSAFSDPQWIYVDLGATYTITRVVLRWEAAYGKAYQIQVSNDASTWTTIYSTTSGDGGVDDLTVSGSGRYVRMYGTARATPYGYSLWEFEVYGTGGNPNLALGRPATASSTESSAFPASAAVDGNTGTRWSSAFSDPQWIYVDLGATYTITRVVLRWEAAYGKAYQIQVSNNASTWTTIYSTTSGDGGVDDLTVSGSGRYVRMYGTARATPYGYSLWEFEVYGSGGASPTNTPTRTPTRTNTPAGPTNTPTRTPTRTNTPAAPTNTPTRTPTRTPTPASAVLLSYNAPAYASSSQNDSYCPNCTPDKAVDLNTNTRWASANWADNEWIYIDLKATANITRVVLRWEAAYGKGYQIQVSNDASTWTTIYSTTSGDGGVDDLTVSGSGRYVRMYGTARGTSYGYSLWEFEVYGTGGSPVPTPSPTRTPTPHDYVLVWSDEFNGSTIDTSNWSFETGCTGWGNAEWENYTAGDNSFITYDSQAGSNVLVIEARQTTGGQCGYTSSRMTTSGKREFTYGRFEARLKLPQTQGIWPAFWLLGNNIGSVGWPTCGELDIMEHIGTEPTLTHGAMHGPGYSGATPFSGTFNLGEVVNANYHVYAIEWTADAVRWYVDNNLFYTVTRSQVQQYGNWVFDHPFFIILNVAVGGSWPGYPDATSVFPQRMYVDYVRVYQ